jgi:UPF0755 protein
MLYSRQKNKMGLFTKILFSMLVLIIVVSAIAWNQYQKFMTMPLHINEQGYVYTVASGSNLQQISHDLVDAELTRLPAEYLHIYGRLINKAHLIKAGEYRIEAQTTLPQLLDLLIAGQVIQYSFTIVEGMTAQQLINMITTDERIRKTLSDTSLPEVMKALELPSNNGEGEFAPETYYFTSGTTDTQILSRAHRLMTTNLEEAWHTKAENLPYKTPYEALIMASIIEKETGIAEERTLIAGVFVRRLEMGMRLQTDPTVIYGLGENFDGNLRRKDLTSDTAYNTYTRHGLPPTPIALPSKESIKAALHPQAGKSLFFVASGHEGRHIFSATLADHNKAVRQYQLKQ